MPKQKSINLAGSEVTAGSTRDRAHAVLLEGIHAGYGKKEVLRRVSLRLAPREILAIVGPNGSGKSTLLKVAAGFLAPTAGQIWFGDMQVTRLAAYERARLGSSYFMQGGRVFPSLTVKENLEMAALSLVPKEREENMSEVRALFPNLQGLFPRRAGLLSGGERQAVAFAMMLVRRPRLLLLDEPSAGLSPKLVQGVLQKVCEINQHWGLSVLLVEQNIRQALRIAHRVLVLVNGLVVLESDKPETLLTTDQLEQVFLGGALKQE
jgi:ABC-type branched-subunit amino acid transport system ATPase component